MASITVFNNNICNNTKILRNIINEHKRINNRHVYIRLAVSFIMIIMYDSERVTEWFKNLMFKGGVILAIVSFIVTVMHSAIMTFTMIWGSLFMASGYLLNHIRLRELKHPHISDIDKETWKSVTFSVCAFIIMFSIWR